MKEIYETVSNWLESNPLLYDWIRFLLILIASVIAYWITKKIVIKIVKKVVEKTKTKLDDIFANDKLLRRLALLVPLYIIHESLFLISGFNEFLERIVESLMMIVFLSVAGLLINSINDFYETIKQHDKKPIKGYLQIVTIVIYVIGGVVIAGVMIGESPWKLLTGIGAMTAILLIIFRDTILSFVASIQISVYDLVREGDWIEIPALSIDGDVMEVNLHTVKVRNFDKTISVFPTHKLISVSFKNWRGMTETGGRRIKRSTYIDIATVKFCSEEMLDRFEKLNLISDYIRGKREEINKYNESLQIKSNSETINSRRLTNIGTFRAYLKAYLKSRKDIKTSLTFLIRQLQPGSEGIPIEIYVFTNTTEWIPYEEIQSDIFDHILAILPEFELQIFQHPTSGDVKTIAGKNLIKN